MNKLTQLIFIINIIIFTSSAVSQNSVEKPEETGRYAFEILKNLSNSNIKNHMTKLISYEELLDLVVYNGEMSNEKVKESISSMSEEEFKSWHKESFYDLKEDGAKRGILWNDIEYLDFVYSSEVVGHIEIGKKSIAGWIKEEYSNLVNEDSGKIIVLGGWLYTKYNNKTYKTEVGFIYNGMEYKLLKFEDYYQE